MSYLLDFPQSQLPYDVRSPPYTVFGIKGNNIVDDLPSRIPLNVVLHFAPKLKQWVLPPPSTSFLPPSIARLALRTPYVGINIISDDIEALGLKWIISRILQTSGVAHPKSLFLLLPTILTSISIHKTWLALDLPIAGIQNLHAHIQTRLMLGPPVTLVEMEAIWDAFPHKSDIVRAMGLNFIRSHLNFEYTHHEFSAVRNWYLKSGQRCRFFKGLEDQFPEFNQVQEVALKAAAVKAATARGTNKVVKAAEDTLAKVRKMLEKTGTRKVSPEEKKERQTKDGDAMRTRLRRTESDESIRSVETVIWNPPQQGDKKEGATDDAATDSNASSTSFTSAQESILNNEFLRATGQRKLNGSDSGLVGAMRLELDRRITEYTARKEYEEMTARSVNNYRLGRKYATIRRGSGRNRIEAERSSQKLSGWRSRQILTKALENKNEVSATDADKKEDTEEELEDLECLQPSVYIPEDSKPNGVAKLV